MNYLQVIAYTNIGLCFLITLLIVVNVIKMFMTNNKEELNKIILSNYEIERELKEIKNKLGK